MSVLDKLEQIRAKILFAVMVGHSFIPVTRLMLLVNRIGRILGHNRPLEYVPAYPENKPERKVSNALDSAHRELFDLLSRRGEVIEKIGKEQYIDLNNMMADLSMTKGRAYNKEHGPGASLLKRGRMFNVGRIGGL